MWNKVFISNGCVEGAVPATVGRERCLTTSQLRNGLLAPVVSDLSGRNTFSRISIAEHEYACLEILREVVKLWTIRFLISY